MDSKEHSKFTGSKATISPKVKGKISAYDDYIDGWNLELVRGAKIVQKWRGSDWPEGHYSTATFQLKKSKAGTTMNLTQTEVPEVQFDDISSGWIEHYWDKMQTYFDESPE